MTMIARLFGIAAVVVGLSASEAFPADSAWKGAWKFQMVHQGQPWLGYYDPKGKTVFLIGCGTHFEVLAAYPATPKQDGRQSATITIASGKTQMDFVGFVDIGSEHTPPDVKMFDQADLGNPDLDQEKWRAGISRAGSFQLRAATDNFGREQKLRAAAGQGTALACALAEDLLTSAEDALRAFTFRAMSLVLPGFHTEARRDEICPQQITAEDCYDRTANNETEEDYPSEEQFKQRCIQAAEQHGAGQN